MTSMQRVLPLAEDLSCTVKWLFDAHTPARKQVLMLAQRAASSTAPILILGPTGVGKEMLANDLHRHSSRKNGPFISVNCAAISPALFESTFDGHTRGSFTGATSDNQGFVEMARGGTLFLDEVGELPVEAQAKLLRFLAQGTYWPLGAKGERHADVRIIAATHRELDKAKDSSFREDLYYRLSVVVLRIPPLESDDIFGIAQSLTREIMLQREKRLQPCDVDTIAHHCIRREWPGGARELRNLIDRTLVLWDTHTSMDEHCAEMLGTESFGAMSRIRVRKGKLSVVRDLDDLLFLALAAECHDVRDLAQRTERTVQAVYVRLRKLGLEPQDIGKTEQFLEIANTLRRRLTPELPWIRSVLGI